MLHTPTRTSITTAALLLFSSLCSIRAQEILENDPTSFNLPSRVETLKLYHRFTYPLTASSPSDTSEWIERGEISVTTSQSPEEEVQPRVEYEQLESAWEGIEVPTKLEENGSNELGGVRYEVSIRKIDQGSEEAGFVSIPSCQLFSKSPGTTLNEKIVLHSSTSSSPSGSPTSFNGFQYSTSGETACKLSEAERSKTQFGISGKENLEIEIRQAFIIPTPILPEQVESKTPVQLDKQGKVIPPPKPKSFIQKYWLYIVPVLIVLMMGGGPEEEQKGGGGGAKK
ncbi:hypothetical protein JCM3765_003276 [Sporobolomyces pararoseus]